MLLNFKAVTPFEDTLFKRLVLTYFHNMMVTEILISYIPHWDGPVLVLIFHDRSNDDPQLFLIFYRNVLAFIEVILTGAAISFFN